MASTSQARAMAIQKLNNIAYSCLSIFRSSVISNWWKYDTTQDWEYLAKNLDGVSTKLIEHKALLRLDMQISATGYQEKRAFCFTEVIGDDEKMIENSREAETVSNSEEKNKKKGFYVKRRKTFGLYCLQPLVRLCLRLLCLCLGLLFRLHLRLCLLCLYLSHPLFYYPLFRLRLVCLCLCLDCPLFCRLLFRLRLVCLCLYLGRWLFRLRRLCLICLCLCLSHWLRCLCLVCLCLGFGCPLCRFLHGLLCKHQYLFREDKD